MKTYRKKFIQNAISLFLFGITLFSLTSCKKESEPEPNSFYKQVDKTFDNLEYIEEKADEQKNFDINEEY